MSFTSEPWSEVTLKTDLQPTGSFLFWYSCESCGGEGKTKYDQTELHKAVAEYWTHLSASHKLPRPKPPKPPCGHSVKLDGYEYVCSKDRHIPGEPHELKPAARLI